MAQDPHERIMAAPSDSRASSGDSCGFYALQQGASCRQPRTCYDCLNVHIASEPNGCFISPVGDCESMEKYSFTMDFRQNDSSTDNGDISNAHGGWHHMFPSTNSTYCKPQDAACVRCREIALGAAKDNSYLASTTKFCLGTSGCVCIVGCEAPTWKNRTLPDCSDTTAASASQVAANGSFVSGAPPEAVTQAPSTGESSRRMIWYLTITQLPLFLLVIYVRARWIRYRRRRKAPEHQLQLPAWRAMHEELIERDKSRTQRMQSVLNSALPPTVPPAISDSSSSSARPNLMTRTERAVWTNAIATRPPL